MSRGRLQPARVLAAFAGFSFLLHFVWEMVQAPLYSNMRQVSHAAAIAICAGATAGDVGIAFVAYAAGALGQRDPIWILHPMARGSWVYLLSGIGITLLFEYLWAGPEGRWIYAPNMPIVPVLGVGLSPLLQWLLLPPLAAWLTFRHSRVC